MTTAIDALLDGDGEHSDGEIDFNNLPEVIMDLSRPLESRIKALNEYYAQKNVGDNAIELFSILSGMYQMSGSKLIEQFFYRVCTHAEISSFLKLEAAKSLLDYEELEEGSDEDDEDDEETQEDKDARRERDAEVRSRNAERLARGYKALDYVCYDLDTMPTPCRIEAILRLMDSDEFQINADSYFREFVRDDNIACDFRYKTILSLENIGAKLMKEQIEELFHDKDFVSHMYEMLEQALNRLFPKMKPDPRKRKFWDKVIFQLSYDDIRPIYREKFPDRPCGRDFFIRKAQLAFLFHDPNDVYYKTLAGQYLLQKSELTEAKRFQVEKKILEFARDAENEYNRRADAADVLLRLGSSNMKQHGRDIVMELGRVDGDIRTVFDNAQNVHTEQVEESVTEALEFLSNMPLHQVKSGKDGKAIDFEYVQAQIEDMLREDRDCLRVSGDGEETCDHCESPIVEKITADEGENKFCSNECLRFYYRDEKIRLALNRIFMDRALYSKFNSSLVNILLKVWTYLIDHENEQEMRKRILEELEEMSGTCSSGFATRLVNVISGFGQFNIRISWEDQIVANFTGRLNAAARKITDSDSIFRTKRANDVVELWLNNIEHKEIRDAIEQKLNPSTRLDKRPKTSKVIEEFLRENRDEKIEECVSDFSIAVLNEMTMASSNYASRQNFSLFFRSYVSVIREELYDEFKDHIDSTEFDLAFRKAIMSYEGDMA